VQKFKGHCLKNIYEKNYSINLWKPLILENSQLDARLLDNKINDLINGNISCIIVNNIITNNDCIAILKKMEDKNLLKNDSPYDNYGINFRSNEIGITVDNILWRDNPEKYFDECIKVNNLFETIFDDNLNPFEIMFETIKKIVGDKYIIERMKNNSNIESPKGLFRILGNYNNAFPYHTDGFNYGKILNNYSILNRKYYSVMSEKINTNSIIGVILKLQEPNSIYEVNLYNCLVDDLENYKDNLGMYSHWMGTKYNNIKLLETILDEKPYYTPLLKSGSIYFFSASRIHKIDSFLTSKNRIVLSTFMCVSNNKITVYQ